MSKRTLVLGASTNPSRASNTALKMLQDAGHETVALGLKKGTVGNVEIQDINSKPNLTNINTLSLYLGPANQEGFLDYIHSVKPKRVIFNPGTENPSIEDALQKAGIETTRACTLVLLSTGQF